RLREVPMKEVHLAPVLLIVLGGTLTPGWLAERGCLGDGPGSRNLSEVLSALIQAEDEGAELDRLTLLTNQRTDALTAIVADVAAGRLGLLEAAAGFRAAE